MADANYKRAMRYLREEPTPVYSVCCGEHTLYYLVKPSSDGTDRKDKSAAQESLAPWCCQTCTARVCKLFDIRGPSGPSLLQRVPQDYMNKELTALCEVIKRTAAKPLPKPTLVLVDEKTFPPLESPRAKLPASGVPYEHITIVPSHCTSPRTAARFFPLIKTYGPSVDERIEKMMCADAAHLDILNEAAETSEHPDHWRPTITWMRGVVTFAHHLNDTAEDAAERLLSRRVFALMTGASGGSVHYDYHKSEMLVGFLAMAASAASDADRSGIVNRIRAVMNGRRDESTYQVSEVTRALADHNITSPCTVSLAWRGESDLDLWMSSPRGCTVSYVNKITDGMHLNLDANASAPYQTAPVENISIKTPVQKGKYCIFVNMFKRREWQDVPFEIEVRRLGLPNKVYDGVWPLSRRENSGNERCAMMHVADVDLAAGTGPRAAQMSQKQGCAVLAKADEFKALIGEDPQPVVYTVEECEGCVFLPERRAAVYSRPPKASVSGRRPLSAQTVAAREAAETRAIREAEAATQAETMACADRKPVPSATARLYELATQATAPSLTVPSFFATVEELIAFVRENGCVWEICLANLSPGFFVKIWTPGDVVRNPVPVHYRDTGKPPMVPTVRGTARGGEYGEWVPETGPFAYVRIIAIFSHMPPNAPPLHFVVIKGARLPPTEPCPGRPRGRPNPFPLKGASGMFPTVLKSEAHAHRHAFSTVGTAVTPTMPAPGSGTPMIGGFLFGDEETFLVNGQEVVVRAR